MSGTPRTASPTADTSLPRASVRDTLRIAAGVGLPTVAGGVVTRREKALALAERTGADRRAVAVLRDLRGRYGPGPLLCSLAGRSVALLLAPGDVERVLTGTPEPFTPANREKRGALAHFQPHGVLVSGGRAREDRRRYNETVLDTGEGLHRLAPAVVDKVHDEARALLGLATATGQLDWDDYAPAWWRLVRRIVLGDSARDDRTLTDLLDRLRSDANWSYFRPRRDEPRRRFERRLAGHLSRAEPGSLAEVIGDTPAEPGLDPAGQVPHWLFAFDAAGMAAFRTLALLATHPEERARVREELAGADLSKPQLLPRLRACVRESLRLWPTSPFILRDSTVDTEWEHGTLPAGTAVLAYAPYFHRAESLPYADRFAPEIWLDGTAQRNPALIPFSAGPGECPGEDLVLLTTSTLLAAFLDGHDFRLESAPRPRPEEPLPYTLSHFGLRFAPVARPGGAP
ncbi:cytochrome P450 [Streptomyces sp. URMC 123]|uniref:cytochrome P450 n=1 Tax=Streptomyces sp. URMC 123 TaxID=3423403 RepID=UPI003F1B2688